MARHRSESEIASMLKAIELQRSKGVPVRDCCKAEGIAEQTYYRWKSLAGADRDDTTRRLRELTVEVDRLKRALADVMLDNQMLREVSKKKW